MPSPAELTWRVQRRGGSVQALHDLEPSADQPRTIWIMEPTDRALVLGSTQLSDVVVPRDDWHVARRRSGGGLVLIDPATTLWIDVVVPRFDPLWNDDVAAASFWLGDAWATALGDGVVHRGGLVRNPWSKLVCFAGIGPGEVTVEGRKLVGVSQRRTRHWARFQCVAYESHDASVISAAIDAPGLLQSLSESVALLPRPRRDIEAALLSTMTH